MSSFPHVFKRLVLTRVQTARLWDPLTGESRMELRGHDHVVEVIAFAPISAYPPIRELGGLPVRPKCSAEVLGVDANFA